MFGLNRMGRVSVMTENVKDQLFHVISSLSLRQVIVLPVVYFLLFVESYTMRPEPAMGQGYLLGFRPQKILPLSIKMRRIQRKRSICQRSSIQFTFHRQTDGGLLFRREIDKRCIHFIIKG